MRWLTNNIFTGLLADWHYVLFGSRLTKLNFDTMGIMADQYIVFEDISHMRPKVKTKTLALYNLDRSVQLGCIVFKPQWRRYVFATVAGSGGGDIVLDVKCMQAIIKKIEELDRERK